MVVFGFQYVGSIRIERSNQNLSTPEASTLVCEVVLTRKG